MDRLGLVSVEGAGFQVEEVRLRSCFSNPGVHPLPPMLLLGSFPGRQTVCAAPRAKGSHFGCCNVYNPSELQRGAGWTGAKERGLYF